VAAARSVSVVALSEASPCAIYGAFDDFGAVGRMFESTVFGGDAAPPAFEPRILTADGRPIHCSGDVVVTPHAGVDGVEHSDIVFVPALMPHKKLHPSHPGSRFDPALTEWIAVQYEQGAVIASVCTGSFVLAEAGVLDGWPATTHWFFGEWLRAAYPAVDVQHRRPIVVTGPDDRLVTGGTGMYMSDLNLYLIQRFAGPERAHQFAKLLGKFWRGDEVDVFARALEAPNVSDAAVRRAQEWIVTNLTVRNPVKGAAELLHLTERTFTRRFRAATGQPPLDYVLSLRLERARNLLERGRLPVEEVAAQVGYADASHFRRLFKKRIGLTPGEYRRRFKLPPVARAAGDAQRSAASRRPS